MDCWPNTLSYSTLYFLQDWQVWFLWQLSSHPVKATSGRLVPLNGHGYVIMVCSELGLHRELANSVLSQFGVIEGHGGPWRAQTWPLDSNCLLASFYTPILSPPTAPHPITTTLLLPPYYYHPITTTCDIITSSRKAAQNRANFGYQKCIHPLSDS